MTRNLRPMRAQYEEETMPQYVITTRSTGRRPGDNPLGMWAAMARQGRLRDEVVDQETADTLPEARDWAAYIIESRTGADPAFEEMYADAQNCSELGDTFGPLPDGTIIEVRPA